MRFPHNISYYHSSLIGLIALFLVAFFLRIYNINFQSYWLDELVSAYISDPNNDLKVVFSETLKGGPPLYQLLLWSWYNLVGFTELSGRLFSAILGSLAVVAIYHLGKEIFNKKIGAISGVILALNEFAIYYSQENRAYSLLLLLSIVASIMLFKLLKSPSKKNFILYFFSVISVFYTHYFGFFVVISHGLFIISFKRDFFKQNIITLAVLSLFISLAILPLFYNLLSLSRLNEFWIQSPPWNFWWYYFIFYFKSRFSVVLFGILISIALIKYYTYDKTIKQGVVFLLLLIIITYALSFIRSILSTPILTERYTIIVLPPIILLISLGIYELRKFLILSLIVISLSFYSIFNRDYYSEHKKENWRQVLNKLKEENDSQLPIYDIVYEGRYFKTYAKLLKLDIQIRDYYEFKEHSFKDKLPNEFWILTAHRDYTRDLEVLNELSLEIKKTFDGYRARAILFTSKSEDSF
ncbi:glycosyltransferase family 39 protein [Salegentibacter sediminis]|uniref:glycosyltransferase family 39 protein n=1 Tax=Salegentibacter sediminis TaxID=1930251 RepID=UPI0012FF7D7F|nr:glycosyltransferase family 39 protein [Salegentibacter sediminis]